MNWHTLALTLQLVWLSNLKHSVNVFKIIVVCIGGINVITTTNPNLQLSPDCFFYRLYGNVNYNFSV